MAIALNADIAARLPEGFQEFLDRLIAEFDPDKVILFGSRARGEASEESDTDLLVVMPCDDLPLRVAHRIRHATYPDFPMDLVVMSPAEFEERQSGLRYAFIPNVVREGVVLRDTSPQS